MSSYPPTEPFDPGSVYDAEATDEEREALQEWIKELRKTCDTCGERLVPFAGTWMCPTTVEKLSGS